ncbi:MAG: FAD-binding protein, partial [Planctomycetes bacterium]|nr:FAD-binding protein [Planctomycetota bacterium]
ADKTGHAILHTLYQQLVRFKQSAERGEMKLYDEWVVVELALEGDECRGVIAMNIGDGRLEAFQAEAVLFATGGSGRIYGNTTNALISTGLGVAIPYWAGLPLKDMEFIQFHPTTLLGTNILMTEGCRGEGGYLLNNKGERFLANYDDSRKLMEVAPRDIVARNITREIMAGRGFENAYVHLGIRHLGADRIMTRLPGIRELCMDFAGVDPVLEPIPIQPGHHYTMGGIDTNSVGATAAKGFYAAGECACVSVHGANRLGGNSLLETVVFGKIAGEAAAQYVLGRAATGQGRQALEDALKRAEERIGQLRTASGAELPADIKDQLGKVMAEKVGIFRDADGLRAVLTEVRQLQERFQRIKLSHTGRKFNFDLLWALELKGNLDVAEAIAAGALAREESRGSHFRTDFPKRDDAAWLKHTVAQYSAEGVRLSYRPVTLGVLEPRERKY